VGCASLGRDHTPDGTKPGVFLARIHDACFAYFNKFWSIPRNYALKQCLCVGKLGAIEFKHEKPKGRWRRKFVTGLHRLCINNIAAIERENRFY
jgi:hypothetical protein